MPRKWSPGSEHGKGRFGALFFCLLSLPFLLWLLRVGQVGITAHQHEWPPTPCRRRGVARLGIRTFHDHIDVLPGALFLRAALDCQEQVVWPIRVFDCEGVNPGAPVRSEYHFSLRQRPNHLWQGVRQPIARGAEGAHLPAIPDRLISRRMRKIAVRSAEAVVGEGDCSS